MNKKRLGSHFKASSKLVELTPLQLPPAVVTAALLKGLEHRTSMVEREGNEDEDDEDGMASVRLFEANDLALLVEEKSKPVTHWPCHRCAVSVPSENLLVCDGCEGDVCLACSGLSVVPESDAWFCPSCGPVIAARLAESNSSGTSSSGGGSTGSNSSSSSTTNSE